MSCHVIPFTLCIVLIKHHACIGDKALKEVVVEELQEIELVDETPKVA